MKIDSNADISIIIKLIAEQYQQLEDSIEFLGTSKMDTTTVLKNHEKMANERHHHLETLETEKDRLSILAKLIAIRSNYEAEQAAEFDDVIKRCLEIREDENIKGLEKEKEAMMEVVIKAGYQDLFEE